MSVQTTIDINREDAENKYIKLRLKHYEDKLQYEATDIADKLLEDLIEEEFYNYNITEWTYIN